MPKQPSANNALGAPPTSPECPKCSAPLKQRQGSRGAFWGCTAFPICKETVADYNGAPFIPAPPASCPHCSPPGLPDLPMIQRCGPKGPYWKCTRCQGTANDAKGKPRVRTGPPPSNTQRQLRNYSETARTGRHPSALPTALPRGHHKAAAAERRKTEKKLQHKTQISPLNWGGSLLPPDDD